MFENLRVVGIGASASYQPTLAATFNPFAIAKGIQDARHSHTKDILSGFEGTVNPGEMLRESFLTFFYIASLIRPSQWS